MSATAGDLEQWRTCAANERAALDALQAERARLIATGAPMALVAACEQDARRMMFLWLESFEQIARLEQTR